MGVVGFGWEAAEVLASIPINTYPRSSSCPYPNNGSKVLNTAVNNEGVKVYYMQEV
jgi:hypothetical protein